MNRAAMKRLVFSGKKELERLVDNSEYKYKSKVQITYELFIMTVILKFLDINNYYLDEKDIFKGSLKTQTKKTKKSIEQLSLLFPQLFKKDDKLYLIDQLLDTEFVEELNNEFIISPTNWQSVEIIGWLYEDYIIEENERIITLNRRYKKEEIPVATQLFTPEWLVKYMVENSLGRYYFEHNGYSHLVEELDYYLKGDMDSFEFKDLRDIRCYDPAMGTGHILTYTFDLLHKFYLEEGYEAEKIPRLILENNIYGLEIDRRVFNIAYFALLLKAEEYREGFLKELEEDYIKNGRRIQLNIGLIREREEFSQDELEEVKTINREAYRYINEHRKGKLYGSLNRTQDFTDEFYSKIFEDFKDTDYCEIIGDLIRQNKIKNGSYEVLVSNPPYIGRRYLPTDLKDMLEQDYPLGKCDMFSAFILYGMEVVTDDGQLGFMTPYVWMFISSYEDLRNYIIDNKNISSLVQLEYSGFTGATVPICAFTLKNFKSQTRGEYIKLSDFKGPKNQPIKTREAVKNRDTDYRYRAYIKNYKKLPASPIAYWANDEIYRLDEKAIRLQEVASPRQGVATGNNKEFLRFWYEVDYDDIGFDTSSKEEFFQTGKLFAPYNKGGKFRKWYGNFDYVIKFDQENYQLLKTRGNKLPSKQYYFKEGISWSFVSSSYFGVRYSPRGSVFDVGGSSVFPEKNLYYILGLMCSKVARLIMEILNPTLNFQVGDVKSLPYIEDPLRQPEIDKLVRENIELAKYDWDSFEISWNFRLHPILRRENKGKTFRESFENWIKLTNKNFEKIRENEERLNEIFLDIYGIKSVDKTVEDREVTLTKLVEKRSIEDVKNGYIIDYREGINSFLSYFLGVHLGRYNMDGAIVTSPDKFKETTYRYKVREKVYLSEIDSLFKNFLVGEFKDKDIAKDLEFIEAILDLREDEELGDYFEREFMDFHNRLYRKKPIYNFQEGYYSYRKLK